MAASHRLPLVPVAIEIHAKEGFGVPHLAKLPAHIWTGWRPAPTAVPCRAAGKSPRRTSNSLGRRVAVRPAGITLGMEESNHALSRAAKLRWCVMDYCRANADAAAP